MEGCNHANRFLSHQIRNTFTINLTILLLKKQLLIKKSGQDSVFRLFNLHIERDTLEVKEEYKNDSREKSRLTFADDTVSLSN